MSDSISNKSLERNLEPESQFLTENIRMTAGLHE